MLDWVREHQTVLWWLGAVSVPTFVGTLVALPLLVVRIPADYFTRRHVGLDPYRGRHPVIRVTLILLKNLLGLVLLIAGLAMLVLPGQGVIMILIALMLLDFPGKDALELWIVRRPRVLRAVNWMRHQARRPPLQLPPS